LMRSGEGNQYDEYMKALGYALINDENRCFQILDKLSQNRFNHVPFVATEPSMDSLRDDPRYKEMVCRIGLPETKWSLDTDD